MSLPLLKPLLLTIGASSLVFFGGVIALTTASSDSTDVLSAANITNQLTAAVKQNTAIEPLSAAMLTSDQAIALAKQNLPNSTLQATPELVNYNGAVAYEVRLDTNTTYIDANLGSILNPVNTSAAFVNDDYSDYDDDEDKYEDHDNDDAKHHKKKHKDKYDKESERLIATSYKHDNDEDDYDD
ncbi:PepSY domain-containing protein [Psychrobacter sp. ANT_H3]|uniref:PepSY domain-containing protein n=1 Tax=Psychrobacter sp. ANT_H3 TaxID=3019444 RepID=UPI0022F1C390|nr:PepSY domain-containing protein [Psychrobacter sp. ANT_H3]MDA5132295.1 PepSY domain-containing protein [Psychrobacter sp. ANT_H3]